MSSSPAMEQTDRVSTRLAMELDELVRELPIGGRFAVPPGADICYSLELFIPAVLRHRYPEWRDEGLDGIFISRAIKTGPATAQVAGTCILIRDQTVTPFMADLEVVGTPDRSSVRAVQLMVGEPGTGVLGISGPPCNSNEARLLFAKLLQRIDDVAWVYTLQDRGG